jgi:hypothetical protein
MVIRYLNSTHCAHGLLKSHSQTCASIRSPRTVHRPSTKIRSNTGLKDYPTVIDGAAFPVRPNKSAPCKVHSIPIHPPH